LSKVLKYRPNGENSPNLVTLKKKEEMLMNNVKRQLTVE
jgi:hypothetical protein